MRLLVSAVIVASSAFVSSVAASQAQAPQQAQPSTGPTYDPIICQKQEVTGSRLATRRVCMTRSQWEAVRLEQRGMVEKAQTQRICNDKTC